MNDVCLLQLRLLPWHQADYCSWSQAESEHAEMCGLKKRCAQTGMTGVTVAAGSMDASCRVLLSDKPAATACKASHLEGEVWLSQVAIQEEG